MNIGRKVMVWTLVAGLGVAAVPASAHAYEASPQEILRQGLFGAGVGALSAEFSGGKAGKGALIGAGTQIIGGALMTLLTQSSRTTQQVVYAQPVQYAAPVQQPVYYEPQPVYVQPAVQTVQYAAPAQDANKKVLRDGLVGAGVGAIAAEASGGKAGTGALVGAGTNVIGGALSSLLFEGGSTTSSGGYYSQAPYTAPSQPYHKRIVRKFDPSGKIVSEEEFWE